MTTAPSSSMSGPGAPLPVADVVELRSERLSQAAASDSAAAVERLDASRDALRLALMRIAHPPKRQPVLSDNADGGFFHKVSLQVRNVPAVALVLDSTQSWWHDQPARAAAAVIVSGSRSAVMPLAQHRPRSLLLAAFTVGAAFVLFRPWRLLFRPALIFGLVARVASHAVKAKLTAAPDTRLLSRQIPPLTRAP